MLPRLDTRYNVVWGPNWAFTYSRLTLRQGVICTLLSIPRRRLTYSKVVLPVESAGRCRHPQLQPYGTLPCWRVGDSAEKGSAARPARVNWCNIHLGLVKGWAKTGLAWGPRRRRVHVVCMSCLVMLTLWSQNDIISSIRLSASPRPLLLRSCHRCPALHLRDRHRGALHIAHPLTECSSSLPSLWPCKCRGAMPGRPPRSQPPSKRNSMPLPRSGRLKRPPSSVSTSTRTAHCLMSEPSFRTNMTSMPRTCLSQD